MNGAKKSIRNHTLKIKRNLNRNDLKGAPPMKNINLGMNFKIFWVKYKIAPDRFSVLLKMGLEFFLAGLEFLLKTHKKA